jgi:hypothetical protein
MRREFTWAIAQQKLLRVYERLLEDEGQGDKRRG